MKTPTKTDLQKSLDNALSQLAYNITFVVQLYRRTLKSAQIHSHRKYELWPIQQMLWTHQTALRDLDTESRRAVIKHCRMFTRLNRESEARAAARKAAEALAAQIQGKTVVFEHGTATIAQAA